MKNAIKLLLQSGAPSAHPTVGAASVFGRAYSEVAKQTSTMFGLWGDQLAAEGHSMTAISSDAPNDLNLISITSIARNVRLIVFFFFF